MKPNFLTRLIACLLIPLLITDPLRACDFSSSVSRIRKAEPLWTASQALSLPMIFDREIGIPVAWKLRSRLGEVSQSKSAFWLKPLGRALELVFRPSFSFWRPATVMGPSIIQMSAPQERPSGEGTRPWWLRGIPEGGPSNAGRAESSAEPVLNRRSFHQRIFFLAGLYNIGWGIYSALDPQWLFRFSSMPLMNHPEIFACMAMVVGV